MTTLTEKAIVDLREEFGDSHKPDDTLWYGIQGLAETLEKMANATLERKPYLSQLDPGVGKTSTAVAFIRNLLAAEEHKDVGVLYCVSRLDEVETLIGKIGESVGVLTSNEEINSGATEEAWKARVLITTQQMVDSRLSKAQSFSELSAFHYLGKPRAVRIWDEALMPAEELTLNVHALAAMPLFLTILDKSLGQTILSMVEHVRNLKADSLYHFPDLGLDYDDVMHVIRKEQSTRLRETARIVCLLQGKEVRIRKDVSGNTVLDYRNHLPEDFFPVVILDASGRVRNTYHLWAKYRKNLNHIQGGGKTYSNLTIHLWNKGGGKDSWRKNSSTLLDGIAETINSKPNEKWLVVVHKQDEWEDRGQKRIPDLEKAIGDRVKEPENVRFLTWGNAHATNDFVDCANVILAGTLFFPEYVYEVRARASMGLSHEERLAVEIYRDLELGEHKHLILQAACRGSARRCVGSEAAPMNLYIIARKETGIPQTMKEIFPGCVDIREWNPVDRPLRGKLAKDVLAYLVTHFKQHGQIITHKEVRRELGIKHSSNLNRVLKEPNFKDWMAKARIRAVSANGSPRITQFIWLPDAPAAQVAA